MNINGSLKKREFIGMKPRIRDIRQSKGLLQKYCAEQIKIQQQLWSQYESGTRYPRIDRAYEIAKVLNCRVEDLYEMDEEV